MTYQTADYTETPQYNGNIASLSWRAPLGTCRDIQGYNFTYDALNLPDVFTFSNVSPSNKIEIVYNAAGEKLEKQVYTGATLSLHKRYVMGIEYTGTTLEAIYHAEGRIVPIGGGVFRYEYTLKDHLGNSRVMFAANGGAIQLLQENHYYPARTSLHPKKRYPWYDVSDSYPYSCVYRRTSMHNAAEFAPKFSGKYPVVPQKKQYQSTRG